MNPDRPAPGGRPPWLALAFVDFLAPVVPRSRREGWRRQWAADLWYQWAHLVEQEGATVRSRAELTLRAAGTVPHALALRMRSWSQPMLMNDVRYGARMLAQRPGFTATAVLILGLGVGANATIFSWVQAFLMTPLPGVADADRLVSVHGTTRTRRSISVSWPNFMDMRDAHPAGVSGMTAHRAVAINVRTTGEPERAWAELVSADFFDVLGVPAAAGRVLVPDDDRAPGASAVAVLSYDYWQRRFARDPNVVGGLISINGRPFTIVGVAPDGFRGAVAAVRMDLWVPMMMQETVMPGDRLTARGSAWLDVVARLASGATVAEAQAGLAVAAAQLASAYPEVNEDRGVAVYPLWRDPSSATAILAPVLGLLMAVVGVVLVIACANVTNLLLARGAGRHREVAVRLALGASRRHIVGQMMTESALLALAGGAAGLAAAAWTSRLLGAFVPPTPLPIVTEASLSPGVFLFGVALALGTTVVFGLVPALQASRPDLVPSLKETTGAIGGRRRTRIRATLLVAQVSLSMVLLVGAGLFVRTLQNTRHADVGFTLEQGLLASIDLLPAGYDQARGTAFFKTLRERVSAVPGVRSAALARDIPLKLG
ncbi:MAG TPA: ABC transporter permease, partial [Vicinamibacterales bacterium]|nr:ABC transporter permease [Vicinamibacterales bacterium]